MKLDPLWGGWTKADFSAWCNRRINSGQWNDPYVLVPLDGLKTVITEDQNVASKQEVKGMIKTVNFSDTGEVSFEVSD